MYESIKEKFGLETHKRYHSYFMDQKHGAAKRGIDWCFTYVEWINWWGDDIDKRGSHKGQLVMARNNDIGPYHPANVRKTTSDQNNAEKKHFKKRIKTPAGVFNSVNEAARYYNVTPPAISYKLSSRPNDYFAI